MKRAPLLKRIGRARLLRDFLLVSISVTVAFVVENYREDIRERQDAKSILQKIIQEIDASASIQTFVVDHSRKHILRFDTILADLQDCRLTDAQALVNLHVYMPYMTDWSGLASFDALKNSGLVSNLANDTLVSALYDAGAHNRRNMEEYRSAWKENQRDVRLLIKQTMKNNLYLNREIGILMVKDSVQSIAPEQCDDLIYAITTWQSTMFIYADIIQRQVDESKDLIAFLQASME